MHKPLIILSKHSITLTTEATRSLLAYTKHFIKTAKAKLDEYTRTQAQGTETRPEVDKAVATLQEEVSKAEVLSHDLEQIAERVQYSYDLDYEMTAEVLRKTRILLNLEKIEDMHSLKVVLEHQIERLKQANPMFSRETFLRYINQGGADERSA